ncbi:MAG: DUF1153 domain-containing protein [Sphingomonadaceae bacterium]|nr:DUF1153 domain-containing protein [Sphingomonadaceae bacterium]
MIELHTTRSLRIVASDPSESQRGPVSLPPRNTTRWVASRKAQVVAAVESGLITIEEAMERYRLSQQEFNAWQTALGRGGVKALRMGCIAERQAEQRRVPERLEDLTAT